MTLDELIDRLQDMRDGLSHGDIEVLVVHQPGYPLQETVRGVWMPDDEPSARCGECGRTLDDGQCPACDSASEKRNDEQHFVYIVADGHHHAASPYGPRRAFDEAF